ncbi:ABC transporter [Drechmeria coniospora]|uniref:ABC transporter n=1 Tax=Drechmeria coniospora TaxID=98403 RepID=A0A151GLF3_DRECN|nr:ABC transporter [Drechmeria coniospora]KYK57930.1 ABC transporter [Drechmeria coniospora]
MEAPVAARPSQCLNDHRFGPAVVGCRDDFDFTQCFEQSMLSMLPSSIFIVAAIVRAVYLYRRPVLVEGGWAFKQSKIMVIGCYLSLQIALLVLACTGTSYGQTAIPAAALSLVAAILVLVVSVAEHARACKPSALLSLYLFFTLLFDVTQSRTQWLSDRDAPFTKVFTASIVTKLTVLLVEAQSKSSWMRDIDTYAKSPETTSSIFNKSVYFWLNDLLIRGYQKPLAAEDLYVLDESLLADNYQQLFWDAFQNRITRTGTNRKSLLLAVTATLKWSFLAPIVPRLAVTAFSFAQPFLINALLRFLREDSRTASANIGYGFIAAAALIYLGLAVSTGFYWYFHQRALVRLRACLVTAIYRKTIQKRANEEGNCSAITLMNSDVGRIQGGIRDLHECWASVLETGLASWLLYRQIRVAFLAPMLVICACTGLTMIVARFAGKRQGLWMKLLQERVALTSAMIPALPAIKMSGLSYQIGRLVQARREAEIAGAKRFRIITTVSTVIAFAPLLLSPVVTFTFSAGSLNIATAFTALSWINLLCQPLTQLFQSVPQLLAALTCFHRVQDFLAPKPHDKEAPAGLVEASQNHVVPSYPTGDGAIKIAVNNGNFGWERDVYVLKEISLSIRTSSFTIITGRMATGKSTLCKAMLQELPFAEGTVLWNDHGRQLAYCDQDPFLLNATIRENIIGSGRHDPPWYEEVVRSCHLSKDLAEMPKGDDTVVGSKGVALSGGQRKRICLARAIYARPDVAILDDVMSGMDSCTESLIFNDVFGPEGVLRRIQTTVVLATLSNRHLEFADWIIILGEGAILCQGSFSDLKLSNSHHQSSLVTNDDEPLVQADIEEKAMPPGSPTQKIDQDQQNQNAAADARRSVSDMSNYRFYFQATGFTMLLPFFATGLGFAFLYNFSSVWVEFWQNSRYGPDKTSFYLGVYFLLQFTCLTLLAGFVSFNGNVMGPRASWKLHLRSLCVLMRSPLEYYTTVDAAVATGYFSQDMSMIDNDLSGSLGNTALTGLTAIGQAALIPVAAPFVLIGYPIILAVLYFVQKFYLRTSTQLRKLMLEAREPLYKHFTETVDGLLTIRAFGWVLPSLSMNTKLLDESQRSSYLLPMLQQWLNMKLNLCVAALAVLFVALATQLRASAGLTGVGLVSLMSLGEIMGNFIRCYAELQTATVALDRLRTFEDDISLEDSDENASAPPDHWPTAGDVNLHGIYADYRTDVPFPGKTAASAGTSRRCTLRDISVSIAPGERVLVCGRTGSGKTSLLLLLQGFLRPNLGRVVIDNIELGKVVCSALRHRIIAIPQMSFFLPGRSSVRQNLEYHGNDAELDVNTYRIQETQIAQDEECEYALRAVGLWDLINSRGGLDGGLDDDALSRGEKQLFSLARAVVRRQLHQRRTEFPEKSGRGVLLLDEFNTGLDMETVSSMWSVIQQEFPMYTVICVAHTLEGAPDFDTVLVMSEGEIIEMGSPLDLLRRRGGKFRNLWHGTTVPHVQAGHAGEGA